MTDRFHDLLKAKMNTETDPGTLAVQRICFYRDRNLLEVMLHAPAVLSCPEYEHIETIIKEYTGSNVLLKITAADQTLSASEMQRYLNRLYESDPETQILTSSIVRYDSGRKSLAFQYGDENDSERASA